MEGTTRASQGPMRTSATILLLLAASAPAAADVDRCATADTDLAWTGTDLAEIGGDTGWFPSSSPAQLRLAGRVVGYTAVETGVQARACWDDGMTATLAGRPDAGWLDVAYGAEVSLRGRIHTTILGKTISWEGNIALPYVPLDLILEDQTTFDPAIDATKIARVYDSTSPITLLSSNVIGDLISIAGISGGLRVTVTPSMATTFRTRKATLAGGTLDSPNDKVTLQPDTSRGFSGGIELPVSTEGLVRYEPSLRFAARFDVKIFGYRVVDWEILSVPMGLPALERTIKLTGEAARLPLPVLEGIGEGARMDFASGTVQELPIRNLGEAPLAIEAAGTTAGAIVSRLDLPPGGQGKLSVYVADDAAFANGPIEVTLATNDPDRGSVRILLGKELGGTDPGVSPEEIEEGGCSTSGGAHLGVGLLLLGLVVRRRRR